MLTPTHSHQARTPQGHQASVWAYSHPQLHTYNHAHVPSNACTLLITRYKHPRVIRRAWGHTQTHNYLPISTLIHTNAHYYSPGTNTPGSSGECVGIPTPIYPHTHTPTQTIARFYSPGKNTPGSSGECVGIPTPRVLASCSSMASVSTGFLLGVLSEM